MIRGGNMNVGKNCSLDMTSHIAMITITNVIRLKTVVIAEFLLQYLIHLFFQFGHDTLLQIDDDAVEHFRVPLPKPLRWLHAAAFHLKAKQAF